MQHRTLPVKRYRGLDDRELVQLLVRDPVARIDVVEFFYREYGELLMAVAIAVVKEAKGRCSSEEYEELASVVVESIAELLEYGARPHPTFAAVADGEPGVELMLLPYVKQIVRNKVRQSWRQSSRFQELRRALEEGDEEANIVYPDFERRDDLEHIRRLIAELKLSAGERVVAEVYLEHFPERPEFAALCDALPQRSTKGVRNAEARFVSKLQQGLGA